MSKRSDPSVGTSRLTAMPTTSEIVIGMMVPWRSACLPASGESEPSIADDARNVPAMSRAVAPSSARRSGTRTSRTPKAIPASIVSHKPVLTRRSLTAFSASRNPCRIDSCGAGTRKVMAMSTVPATAAVVNTGPVPTS
jgi:hypothetical protein